MVDVGIFDKMIHLVKQDDFEIKREAIWVLSNCTTSATLSQMQYLVGLGLI